MTSARPLERDDWPRAAESLASAFAHDPVVAWTMREDAPLSTLERAMVVNLRVFAPHGLCFTIDDVCGAALWAPHDRWRLPLWRELSLLPTALRYAGAHRLPRLVEGLETLKAHHPHEPHYYLYILGVHARHQGRGLGAVLVQPMLERCDREGVGAYLESTSDRNTVFYRRLGFEVREEFRIGRGGPVLRAMWRLPRGLR